MKPYQLIKPDGEWVDLSAIQSICPPVFIDQMGHGGYFAMMSWRCAFQDKPRELWWNQDYKPEGGRTTPKLNEQGIPTEVARMTKEVFEPLFKAWSEQDSQSSST